MGGYVKGLRQNRVAPYPPRRKNPPLRMQPTTIQQKYVKATDNDQRGAAATRTAHANLQKGLRTCTHGNKPPTASARTFCKFAAIARPWGCRAEQYNKLQASYKQVTSKLPGRGYFRTARRPTSSFTRREFFLGGLGGIAARAISALLVIVDASLRLLIYAALRCNV